MAKRNMRNGTMKENSPRSAPCNLRNEKGGNPLAAKSGRTQTRHDDHHKPATSSPSSFLLTTKNIEAIKLDTDRASSSSIRKLITAVWSSIAALPWDVAEHRDGVIWRGIKMSPDCFRVPGTF